MDKILEMLGVGKLEESQQTEIKEQLQTIIDSKVKLKAKEISEKVIEEEREDIVNEMEEKFEEYKRDITSKFSNFVDSIIDEEMVIPDKVMEFARKGELYTDLIEQFKVRLSIDEGLLDNEVRNLLKEARDEIVGLRKEVNDVTSKKLEIENDAQELAANLYLRNKCDGLTESHKLRVLNIMEGIHDREEIDKKFDLVVESIKSDVDENGKKKVVNEEGKGSTEVEVEKDGIVEDGSPFSEHLKEYKKRLRGA